MTNPLRRHRSRMMARLPCTSLLFIAILALVNVSSGLRLFRAGPIRPGARSSVDAFRCAVGAVQSNTAGAEFDPSALLSKLPTVAPSPPVCPRHISFTLPRFAGATREDIAVQHNLIEECVLDECCLAEECEELESEIEASLSADDEMGLRLKALKRISLIKKTISCIEEEISLRFETLSVLESQRKSYVAMLWDDRGDDRFDI